LQALKNQNCTTTEITEAIIGCAFEVDNHLGYGFLHRVYQRTLQVELLRRDFKASLGQRITVRYKDAIVGEYDADLIVDGSVLVEIKIAPQYGGNATKPSY
jgi:GxxExxY protein